MSNESASEFSRRVLITHALSMSMPDAVLFLRGILALTGDTAEMLEVKRAYQSLTVGFDQLELIAHPQGELNLNGKDGSQ